MSRTAADGVRVTPARLADGREIVYFDEDGAPPRVPEPDRRDLPPLSTASELRFDPLLREWVVIASHRQGRTHLPAADACPLCPSTADRATEVPAGDYDVVVFENRFPSLAADGGRVLDDVGEVERSRRPGTGRCEVVVFGPDHNASFADLTPRRVRTVLEAWTQRTRALSALPGTEQVYCFENRGPEIGVSLHHPHGQVYALPFVTPRTRDVLASARAHREETGGDLFEDVLAAERAGPRVVLENGHWTAFVPEAARWPVEVHLYPRRPVADLPDLGDAERDAFAELYADLLARLDRLFDLPLPYVAAWHQAPLHDAEARSLSRLRLEVFSVRRAPDRLKYLAGTESGMGVFVNDVAPETTARLLRKAGR